MESDIISPFKVMNYAVYDVENPPEEFGNLSSFGVNLVGIPRL